MGCGAGGLPINLSFALQSNSFLTANQAAGLLLACQKLKGRVADRRGQWLCLATWFPRSQSALQPHIIVMCDARRHHASCGIHARQRLPAESLALDAGVAMLQLAGRPRIVRAGEFEAHFFERVKESQNRIDLFRCEWFRFNHVDLVVHRTAAIADAMRPCWVGVQH